MVDTWQLDNRTPRTDGGHQLRKDFAFRVEHAGARREAKRQKGQTESDRRCEEDRGGGRVS